MERRAGQPRRRRGAASWCEKAGGWSRSRGVGLYRPDPTRMSSSGLTH